MTISDEGEEDAEGGSESDTEGEMGEEVERGGHDAVSRARRQDGRKRDSLSTARFTLRVCARRLVCEKDLHWLEAEALYTTY